LIEEVLPGSGEDFIFRMTFLLRFLPVKKGSGFFEFGFGIAGSQETVVADFDKA